MAKKRFITTNNGKIDPFEMPTLAYYSGFGAFAGLEVKEILYGIDDFMVCVSSCPGSANTRQTHKLKIYYNSKNPFVRFAGCRLPLNEFIRTNLN